METDGTSEVHYTYGHDLINQTRNSQTNYYHYDGLGSTRSLSDSAGNITDFYNYEAFGEVLNQTGETENNYLFTGEQFDSSLNQYYLRARYYDQGIGRFTQMDTWQGYSQDPITLHKYLYANSDPVMYVDFSGNNSIASQMVVAAGIATLASYTAYSVGKQFVGSQSNIDGSGKSNFSVGWLLIAVMVGPNANLFGILANSAEGEVGNQKEDAFKAGKQVGIEQTTEAELLYGGRRAVIGENQLGRVVPAAMKLKAITIRYTDDYDFPTPLSAAAEIVSIAFNQGWIHAIMASDFEIYDIGRDPTRTGVISPWYAMERAAVRGYYKHYQIKWP